MFQIKVERHAIDDFGQHLIEGYRRHAADKPFSPVLEHFLLDRPMGLPYRRGEIMEAQDAVDAA